MCGRALAWFSRARAMIAAYDFGAAGFLEASAVGVVAFGTAARDVLATGRELGSGTELPALWFANSSCLSFIAFLRLCSAIFSFKASFSSRVIFEVSILPFFLSPFSPVPALTATLLPSSSVLLRFKPPSSLSPLSESAPLRFVLTLPTFPTNAPIGACGVVVVVVLMLPFVTDKLVRLPLPMLFLRVEALTSFLDKLVDGPPIDLTRLEMENCVGGGWR